MATPAIDIEKLAPEERLQLIDELWESLRARPEAVRLTQAQRDELDRRLDALDRGEGEATPWDEVKRRLQGELGE
jgi:putative addiction module component (TIGR02574 family)